MQVNEKCSGKFYSEFKLNNFGFSTDQADEFYRSQWQKDERSWWYLIYRWIWAAMFVGTFISSAILQFAAGKFFIFLTNWGILLCAVTQLLAALLVSQWHFNLSNIRTMIQCDRAAKLTRAFTSNTQGQQEIRIQNGPWVKFYWLIHHVTLMLALIITTVYWAFLHGKMNKPTRFPVLSFVTHCLNSVCMVIDFFVVGFPVRLYHTLYAMLMPIIFCTFTVFYYLAGGTDEFGNHYVYPIMDWTKPVRGIVTFVGVFSLYCIYGVVLFALYKLKRLLHRTFSVVWSPHCVDLI